MMPASTDARHELTAALNAAGVTAYSYRPPTAIPPVAWIETGDPWLVPTRIGERFSAELRLSLSAAVQNASAAPALDQLEELVDQIVAAMPKGWRVVEVSAADVEQLGAQGELLVSTLTVSANITD